MELCIQMQLERNQKKAHAHLQRAMELSGYGSIYDWTPAPVRLVKKLWDKPDNSQRKSLYDLTPAPVRLAKKLMRSNEKKRMKYWKMS